MHRQESVWFRTKINDIPIRVEATVSIDSDFEYDIEDYLIFVSREGKEEMDITNLFDHFDMPTRSDITNEIYNQAEKSFAA